MVCIQQRLPNEQLSDSKRNMKKQSLQKRERGVISTFIAYHLKLIDFECRKAVVLLIHVLHNYAFTSILN